MTDKTPIEKAAKDIRKRYERFIYPEDEPEIADIIRRRLEKEVPDKEPDHAIKEVNHMRKGHNQCRRDIGLRDEEETT